MTRERDSVVALITSALSPARMALRVSGATVPELWLKLLGETWPSSYAAFEKSIEFPAFAIPCKVFCMPEGRSYTREHVLEIHFPANEELSRLLLERIFSLGVRPAEPGEFTRRAFLNGRLQLNQAQSVAALIAATDQRQRREAVQIMSSGQGDLLKDLKESIFILRRNLEAVIDFPEEPDVEKEDWRWGADLARLEEQLVRWQNQDARQRNSSVAIKILLLGPANAGKSSLVRALVPGSMPVVSHVPGTTLDLVPYALELGEERLQLYDSPGLKDIENSWDELSLGKLHERLEAFDGYLLLQAVNETQSIHWPSLPSGAKVLKLSSKVDMPRSPSYGNDQLQTMDMPISALRGDGIAELKKILSDWARELSHQKTSPFAALRQRLVALALERLVVCKTLLISVYPNEELAAYELDELLDEIDGLTGQEGGSEALLDGIFRDFCIGK